jgi:hypothetical protein
MSLIPKPFSQGKFQHTFNDAGTPPEYDINANTIKAFLDEECLIDLTAPELVAEHGYWVYLGGGDSYHIQIVVQ